MSEFYSKAALEKLSSPEKLDQMITVVGTKGWISLAMFGLAIVAIIGWGIFGTIKTKVAGTGMLIGGDVHDIVPVSSGQIIYIHVNPGDIIKKGDVIAEIHQPELEQQIKEAEARLKASKLQHKQLSSFGSQDIKLQESFLLQQKTSIEQSIINNQQSIEFLKQQLKIEKGLLDKGLITKLQLVTTEQKLNMEKDQLEQKKTQLKKLSSQELNTEYSLEQKLMLSKQQTDEFERSIAQLKERKDLHTHVRSPYDGHILEVMSDRGSVINVGMPIAKLGMDDNKNKLHAVIFLSSNDGKKINNYKEKKTEVLISPVTIKPQEHGYIKGSVRYISEYPSSQQGMMRILKNEMMVQLLSQKGAPFEMYVELETDKTNGKNGFVWTSGNGPEMSIYAGTPCMALTTIMEQRPITLVIPALKKFFNIY